METPGGPALTPCPPPPTARNQDQRRSPNPGRCIRLSFRCANTQTVDQSRSCPGPPDDLSRVRTVEKGHHSAQGCGVLLDTLASGMTAPAVAARYITGRAKSAGLEDAVETRRQGLIVDRGIGQRRVEAALILPRPSLHLHGEPGPPIHQRHTLAKGGDATLGGVEPVRVDEKMKRSGSKLVKSGYPLAHLDILAGRDEIGNKFLSPFADHFSCRGRLRRNVTTMPSPHAATSSAERGPASYSTQRCRAVTRRPRPSRVCRSTDD